MPGSRLSTLPGIAASLPSNVPFIPPYKNCPPAPEILFISVHKGLIHRSVFHTFIHRTFTGHSLEEGFI